MSFRFGLKNTRFPFWRVRFCNGLETKTLLKKLNKRMPPTRDTAIFLAGDSTSYTEKHLYEAQR